MIQPSDPFDPPSSWSSRLWSGIEEIYPAILGHPFLTGLTDGDLDPAAFSYYVAQDAHYLRDYARALAIVGAKAATHEQTAMFARHAAGAVEVELSLHSRLLGELGLDATQLESAVISPTTRAYCSYLLATAYGGTFAEGLAAVLPCYWIYARVGAELAAAGSPDLRFQRWIDTYAGEEFALVVNEVLAVTDQVGAGLSETEATRAQAHFVTTSRYEWMFWDAAWRQERWPLS
ncbi:thiaminase II [Jatrophihabitans sp. GAS493]|uniref:thiaminase II n=1 Tax=Jatrophihabitans sp. GAS493 TaxID=1907575 RepID=UPI000BB92704|nr:thiaminase II [Jatrophihabitans sp. GAS493]